MADAPADIHEDIAGEKSFAAPGPEHDPFKSLVKHERPENVPEKFWNSETGQINQDALLKSYAELEKQFSSKGEEKPAEEKPAEEQKPAGEEEKPAEEKPAEEEKPGEEKPAEEEKKPDEGSIPLATAIESAQAYFAEHHDLPAEARKDLHALGISDQVIDLQISGAKAYTAAIQQEATKAAGVDDYSQVEAAMQWAASNWSEKKILAFNAASGDVETVGLAVSGLFKEYRAANPGEGELLNVTGGTNRGDVYSSKDEYSVDLQKADAVADPTERRLARNRAVEKMRRSLKAKSIRP